MASGKTIWHLTMSLDGFMADRNGSLAWMRAASAPAPLGQQLVPEVGAILAGRRTYDVGMAASPPDGGKAYGGAYRGPVFVLTHRLPDPAAPADISFVRGDLSDALRVARAAAGYRHTVVFGADVGQQCLRRGELDELLVHVVPVFLGGGTPVYRSEEPGMVEFEVLEASPPAELTSLRLRPRPAPPSS
jgi:dihydrofolate reductase